MGSEAFSLPPSNSRLTEIQIHCRLRAHPSLRLYETPALRVFENF